MKLLICGYGFVGEQHATALECSDNDIHIFDPDKGFIKWPLDVDAVIIAVSTPQAENGSCDMSNVYDVLDKCPNNIPILIKSTISLEGWRYLKSIYRRKDICFSPEYLRAAHAKEDFYNQEKISVGGSDKGVLFWQTLLTTYLGVHVHREDPEALILAKYFRNSFLATKVSFFNQMYDLCMNAGVSPHDVAYLVTEDDRIGKSHSYVTRERGFGGHCFPKDTTAIVKTGERFGTDLSLIREAVIYNDKVRK